jgi:hypothetical protein
MTIQNYDAFLERKRISDPATGIKDSIDLPSFMFPHQRDITQWALRRGRAAVFAGTGLGKTAMELVWADNVARYTGKPVLVLRHWQSRISMFEKALNSASMHN